MTSRGLSGRAGSQLLLDAHASEDGVTSQLGRSGERRMAWKGNPKAVSPRCRACSLQHPTGTAGMVLRA